MTCDIETLYVESKCFRCLSERQILAIITYFWFLEWCNSLQQTR